MVLNVLLSSVLVCTCDVQRLVIPSVCEMMEGRFHVHTLITVLNELEMFEHQRTASGCIHVYVCVCRNKRNMLLLTERKRS